MLSIWNPFLVANPESKRVPNRSLFDTFFYEPFEGIANNASRWGIEYKKNEDASLSVSIDVPGIEEKDITVEVSENNILSVIGERKTKNSSYTVNKSFHISDEYESKDIKAELRNGVLTVTVPSKPKKTKEAVKVTITTVK
jgi:HSP20 family protein